MLNFLSLAPLVARLKCKSTTESLSIVFIRQAVENTSNSLLTSYGHHSAVLEPAQPLFYSSFVSTL